MSMETRAKLSAITAAKHGVAVEVTNIKTGEIVQYSTMTAAGVALGVSRTAIKKVIQSGKIFAGGRDNYIIKMNEGGSPPVGHRNITMICNKNKTKIKYVHFIFRKMGS